MIIIPFAGYKDFQDCVNKNRDKDNPRAYCGSIYWQVEGSKKMEKIGPAAAMMIGSAVGSLLNESEKQDFWGQLEGMDPTKLDDVIKRLEEIDKRKEAGEITEEQHTKESRDVLIEMTSTIGQPIKKAMRTRVGKKRVTMTREDGVKQHYWMKPEEIAEYKALGRDVQVVGEAEEKEPRKETEKTVAIDFDGTVVKLENPEELVPGAKEALQELANAGWKIIIFSGRGMKDLEQRLERLGIDTYDEINVNTEEPQPNPGKVAATHYIDDRAVPFEGNWKETLSKLKGEETMEKTDIFSGGTLEKMMKMEKDGRPPKDWFDNCLATAGKFADDPSAFCGWMWHRGGEEGFAPQREAIGKAVCPLKKDEKCPLEAKKLKGEEKIKIDRDLINELNPNQTQKEDNMDIKKDESATPPTPEAKDPLAEIKEMLASISQRLGALESKITTPMTKEPEPALPPKEVPVEEVPKEEEVVKAEPVKTVKVPQGQKEQTDKELGPDKVSGKAYLSKEDAESLIEATIKKMGYTVTPKPGSVEPGIQLSPLEKEQKPDEKDWRKVAGKKWNDIHETAFEQMGGRRL